MGNQESKTNASKAKSSSPVKSRFKSFQTSPEKSKKKLRHDASSAPSTPNKTASAATSTKKKTFQDDDSTMPNTQKKQSFFGKKSVKKSSLIVAAIDFGTTFSGFAYCTKDGYRDPTGPKIHMHTWAATTTMTAKAPTCVLLDSAQEFKSFGYKANTEFQDDENAVGYCYFFKHFKMKLYELKDELTRDTMLESENGRKVPAIRVFSSIIQYFRNLLLKDLTTKDTKSVFSRSDIHWVITVPAIWNLKAKQFMREAAHMAEIEDSQLTLALEPEAASLYCRRVPNSVVRDPGDGPSIANFTAGAKYLIMDLGGGTIDITAHEVLEDGHLKEINEPTGGYWGGLRVNEQFTRFLQRLCGQDVLSELKENNPADWQAILDDFELKKCAYDPRQGTGRITFRVPLTLVEEFENITGCKLSEAIAETPLKGQIEFRGDKLRIDKAIFEKFFEESVTKVVGKVEKLLTENTQLRDLDTILVVGGYAESLLMQNAIKEKFSDRYKIVIPSDPSIAILKGAVMYGFELDAVKARVCKYTYGIGHQRKFIEGFDNPEKKRKHGRHFYVDDAFDRHVSKGDLVNYGKFQDGKDYHPVHDHQTQAWFDFYASDDKDPQFVYENSCACLGFVGVELSPREHGVDATVMLEINISGTDIEVRATEKRTGNVTNAYCNFLG